MVVKIQANNVTRPELASYTGFIENNGFISMKAMNYSKQTAGVSNQWKLVNDIGYTGNGLQAFSLNKDVKSSVDTNTIKQSNGRAEYDFYTFSSALYSVNIFALPTHPLNNNNRVRYAVSIDNGPLEIVDIKTFGRSEEWKQNVLRNRTERKISMPYLSAGKHTLQIYCVDPGVILDEIRIDLGGLKRHMVQLLRLR